MVLVFETKVSSCDDREKRKLMNEKVAGMSEKK